MNKPRIGLIARADNTGLGNLTWEFYKHLNPAKTIVVDFSSLRGTKSHAYRYPGSVIAQSDITDQQCLEFLTNIDILYTDETPYNYYMFDRARKAGIVSVLHYNYEFLMYRSADVSYPDILLSPSVWHYDDIKRQFSDRCEVDFLQIPVNRKLCKFRKRTKAMKFLHVMGNQTGDDRNGTEIFLQSLKHVKNKNIKFILATQGNTKMYYNEQDPRLKIAGEFEKYEDIYSEADVIIMPRRFGGLCLPLNEAMSCGLVPIMTDLSPQNSFLHKDSLIPTNNHIERSPCQINIFDADPEVLAKKIDDLAETNISKLSEHSNKYAESISWDKMIPQYIKFFNEAIKKYGR